MVKFGGCTGSSFSSSSSTGDGATLGREKTFRENVLDLFFEKLEELLCSSSSSQQQQQQNASKEIVETEEESFSFSSYYQKQSSQIPQPTSKTSDNEYSFSSVDNIRQRITQMAMKISGRNGGVDDDRESIKERVNQILEKYVEDLACVGDVSSSAEAAVTSNTSSLQGIHQRKHPQQLSTRTNTKTRKQLQNKDTLDTCFEWLEKNSCDRIDAEKVVGTTTKDRDSLDDFFEQFERSFCRTPIVDVEEDLVVRNGDGQKKEDQHHPVATISNAIEIRRQVRVVHHSFRRRSSPPLPPKSSIDITRRTLLSLSSSSSSGDDDDDNEVVQQADQSLFKISEEQPSDLYDVSSHSYHTAATKDESTTGNQKKKQNEKDSGSFVIVIGRQLGTAIAHIKHAATNFDFRNCSIKPDDTTTTEILEPSCQVALTSSLNQSDPVQARDDNNSSSRSRSCRETNSIDARIRTNTFNTGSPLLSTIDGRVRPRSQKTLLRNTAGIEKVSLEDRSLLLGGSSTTTNSSSNDQSSSRNEKKKSPDYARSIFEGDSINSSTASTSSNKMVISVKSYDSSLPSSDSTSEETSSSVNRWDELTLVRSWGNRSSTRGGVLQANSSLETLKQANLTRKQRVVPSKNNNKTYKNNNIMQRHISLRQDSSSTAAMSSLDMIMSVSVDENNDECNKSGTGSTEETSQHNPTTAAAMEASALRPFDEPDEDDSVFSISDCSYSERTPTTRSNNSNSEREERSNSQRTSSSSTGIPFLFNLASTEMTYTHSTIEGDISKADSAIFQEVYSLSNHLREQMGMSTEELSHHLREHIGFSPEELEIFHDASEGGFMSIPSLHIRKTTSALTGSDDGLDDPVPDAALSQDDTDWNSTIESSKYRSVVDQNSTDDDDGDREGAEKGSAMRMLMVLMWFSMAFLLDANGKYNSDFDEKRKKIQKKLIGKESVSSSEILSAIRRQVSINQDKVKRESAQSSEMIFALRRQVSKSRDKAKRKAME